MTGYPFLATVQPMAIKRKPLFVKLAVEDRVRLDKVAADAAASMGRPVNISDVIRQLVRNAYWNRKPLKIQLEDGL